MHFDFTVNAGDIAIILTVIGLFSGYARSRRQQSDKSDKRHQDNQDRMLAFEGQLKPIWSWFERNVINGHPHSK